MCTTLTLTLTQIIQVSAVTEKPRDAQRHFDSVVNQGGHSVS